MRRISPAFAKILLTGAVCFLQACSMDPTSDDACNKFPPVTTKKAPPGGCNSCQGNSSDGQGSQCKRCCASTSAGARAEAACEKGCPRDPTAQARAAQDGLMASRAATSTAQSTPNNSNSSTLMEFILTLTDSQGKTLHASADSQQEFVQYFDSKTPSQRSSFLTVLAAIASDQACVDRIAPKTQAALDAPNALVATWAQALQVNPAVQSDRFKVYDNWMEGLGLACQPAA